MDREQIDSIIHPRPHPLKAQVCDAGLSLFQLKVLTDGPEESMLSRILNSQRPMPAGLEERIEDALVMVKEHDAA
jgi:hypothetical protein